MASESSSSRSSSSVDSYIGSLISLTSKSEIRYEGVLYNINTDESSIGLRNVRSFGTEGRKQDGPQIPPSDKVYEYILFRGSDIKDLQVKSSPPVQPPIQQINNDPAIIQSHYPQVSSSTSLPSAVSGSTADLSSHSAQFGLPGSNFQGALPLYQPGANLGPWGASPSQPTANGSGLAMPMYWQGYYSPNGLPMHQQSLLHPPSGLSMSPSMQHPLHYPNFNASMPTGASHMPGPNFPEVPSPFLPASSYISNSPLLPPTTLPSSSSLLPPTTLPPSSSMLPPTTLPSSSSFTPPTTLPSSSSLLPPAALPSSSSLLPRAALPSSLSLLSPATLTSMRPPATSTTICSDTSLAMMPNKTPSSTPTSLPLSASVPPPLISSSPELSAITPPVGNMPNAVSGQTLAYKSASLSTSTVGATNTNQTGLPTPPRSSSLSSQATHKDVEVVQISQPSLSEPSAPVAIRAQSPILPSPARPHRKANGDPYQNRHGYRGRERGRGIGGRERGRGIGGHERGREIGGRERGRGTGGRERGRGTGSSHTLAKFTEEFDFAAMNEKFNKEEVWGDLGKNNKSPLKDKETDGSADDEYNYQDEDDAELSKVETKHVYNKDDFFDTISCNTLDRNSNGWTKFSEQRKIDTETFGEFARYRGGRGGRYRGGRGHGYVRGRGRGRSVPSRAS